MATLKVFPFTSRNLFAYPEGEGRGGGVEKLLLLRTLAVRHSGAGQPSVRSEKRMVAKEKNSASNGSNQWQNWGFANSPEYETDT